MRDCPYHLGKASRQDEHTQEGEGTMSRTVRYEFEPGNLPPLTAEQKAELKALAEKPEDEIDTSDIPPLDDEFWKKGGAKSVSQSRRGR